MSNTLTRVHINNAGNFVVGDKVISSMHTAEEFEQRHIDVNADYDVSSKPIPGARKIKLRAMGSHMTSYYITDDYVLYLCKDKLKAVFQGQVPDVIYFKEVING